MLADVSDVVGFDLGHGKTALAWARVDGKANPEIVEGAGRLKFDVTAIARHPEKGLLIGEAAMRQAGVAEFEIAFKRRPSRMSADNRRDISDFVGEVYRRAEQTGLFPADSRTRIFVGCPSGWKEEGDEVGEYQKLLAEAISAAHQPSAAPGLEVVPESRAAMMHAAEGGQLRTEHLAGWSLVIDIGSSTTDFTLVRGKEQRPFDAGADLGGSLLDRAILRQRLADPDLPNGAVFRERAELNRAVRNRLELTCRRAKDEYFRDPAYYQEPGDTTDETIKLPGIGAFTPSLNKAVLDAILSQPLPELAAQYPGASAEDQTWPGVFRMELAKVAQTIAEEHLTLSAILLTGGGSRMPFIHDICQEVFPGVERIQGSEPELCIAQGLSRWGRVAVRTTRFKEEVDAYVNANLTQIVAKHMDSLVSHLVDSLTDSLIASVVTADLHAWRQGTIDTTGDLEQRLKADMQEWLTGPNARRLMSRSVADCAEAIQVELKRGLKPIFVDHGLTEDSAGSANAPDAVVKLGVIQLSPDLGSRAPDTVAGNIGGVIAGTVAMALIVIGPAAVLNIALLPALLIAGAVAVISDGGIKRWARGDIPHWSRKLLLPDRKIAGILKEKTPELRKTLCDQLRADQELKNKVVDYISRAQRQAIDETIDRARLLIS